MVIREPDDGPDRKAPTEPAERDRLIGDSLGGNTTTTLTQTCACGFKNSFPAILGGFAGNCDNPDLPKHLIDDWPPDGGG